MNTTAYKWGITIRRQKNSINVAVLALQLSLKDVLSTTNLPPFTGIKRAHERHGNSALM